MFLQEEGPYLELVFLLGLFAVVAGWMVWLLPKLCHVVIVELEWLLDSDWAVVD